MYETVKVSGTSYGDLEFSSENNEIIFNSFKKWNDRSNKYTAEEIEKLKEALEILNDYPSPFRNLEIDIDEVEVDEDEIDDAYNNLHWDSHAGEDYDDGYDAALDSIKNQQKNIKNKYGTLFHKLDKLVYNYGNVEPLTKEETKDILNILEYQYD